MQGWFEFADGRPIDSLALLLVADAFPPPVFNIDIPRRLGADRRADGARPRHPRDRAR